MLRLNRKNSIKAVRRGLVLISGLLPALLILPPAVIHASENIAAGEEAEEILICGEDEYIGLRSGIYSWVQGNGTEDVFNLYDCHGNPVGTCMASLGVYDFFILLRKDGLYQDSDREKTDIYSINGMKQFLSLPKEEYAYAALEDAVFTYEYNTCMMRLYDHSGALLAEKKAGLLEGTEFGPGKMQFGTDATRAQLVKGNGFYYMKLFREELVYAAIWFPREDRWFSVEDPDFPKSFLHGCAGALGEYLVIRSEMESDDEDDYDVFCLDGECVLSHVKPRPFYDMSSYRGIRTDNKLLHVMKKTADGNWLILDESLSVCGTSDESWFMYCGYSDIIEGNPYSEFGGRVCDGTILWEGQRVPYVQTETGVDVLVDGNVESLAVPNGKVPESANSLWIFVREEDRSYLYSRESGELLMDSERNFHLQKDSVMKWKDLTDSEDEFRVYNKDLQLVYHTDRIMWPCGREVYFLQRGPYSGISDMYGNWLVRELPSAE